MKVCLSCMSLIAFLFTSCITDGNYYGEGSSFRDTVPPFIRIIGYTVDTAYLFSDYKDQGAEVFDDKDGLVSCNDATLVTEVNMTVNTRLPGVYFIHYHANDSMGNPLTTATRTVHVVENSTTFLNGNYNVACTCTAMTKAASQPSITNGQYTVVVNPSSEKNKFGVSSLEIGSEVLVPDLFLEGNKIDVFYWSTNLQQIGGPAGTGTVSPSKNSFTIESTAYPYQPLVTYHCVNVFTKQLIIK